MIKLTEQESTNTTDDDLEQRVAKLEEELKELKYYLGKVANMAYMGACNLTPSHSATTDFYRIWRELDK